MNLRELRSYVIRVYRQRADELVGTVQEVRSGRVVPFQSMPELWEALRNATRSLNSRRRPQEDSSDNGDT